MSHYSYRVGSTPQNAVGKGFLFPYSQFRFISLSDVPHDEQYPCDLIFFADGYTGNFSQTNFPVFFHQLILVSDNMVTGNYFPQFYRSSLHVSRVHHKLQILEVLADQFFPFITGDIVEPAVNI